MTVADDGALVGVVLAAGAGRRLAPLTDQLPKAACPVGGRPLVFWALDRVATVTSARAVNLHHGAQLLDALVPMDVHRSREQPRALGTAGALGALAPWIDGRDVVVTNADAWLGPLDLAGLVEGWDRQRVRLLCVEDPTRGDFGSLRYAGVALQPAASISRMRAEPSGLYEVCWRAEAAAGRLDLVVHPGPFVDCGSPADYLAANLAASAGEPVVDATARVGDGARLVRSVVWAEASVEPGEVLLDAIRTRSSTVLVRRWPLRGEV